MPIIEGMIRAIIFDADGPLYRRTTEIKQKTQVLLTEFGYTGDIRQFDDAYEQEKFKGYVGAETPVEMFQNILHGIGLAVSSDQAARFAQKFDALHRQVTAVPDAIATLRRLKHDGFKICVLTDSCYPAVEKWSWFRGLGMDGYLDQVVSSCDIRKLKDTPEAYRACLDLLEVAADETVFVGHQAYEMAGAWAAKVVSIAVTPIATPDLQADYAINSLSELPELLKTLQL